MSDGIKITDLNEAAGQSLEDSLTPVQKEQVKDTSAIHDFDLPSGRKIAFKKPSGVVSFMIAKMLGQESMNPALNIYYTMVMSIASLDGQAVRTPTSSMQVEALVERLGDDFNDAMFTFQEWAGLAEEQSNAKK